MVGISCFIVTSMLTLAEVAKYPQTVNYLRIGGTHLDDTAFPMRLNHHVVKFGGNYPLFIGSLILIPAGIVGLLFRTGERARI